jgi:hypothetical protein
MPFNRFSKLIRPAALIIALFGFALRLHQLGSESLWYDELLQANLGLVDVPTMLYRLAFHSALPLDYLITHYWIYLATPDILERIPGDFWMRLPAVVAGTLTLPIAFQLGRSLLGDGAGLLVMALLTFSPFHLRFSQEVRPYALGVFGVCLFVYLIWRIRSSGAWRYLPPAILAGQFFALSHFFADVIFGPLLLLFGLDILFGKNRKSSLKAMVALLATGLSTLLILLALGWGQTLFNVSNSFAGAITRPEQFVAPPEEKPNRGSGPIVTEKFIRGQILGPLGAGATDHSLWLMNGLVLLGFLSLIWQRKYSASLLLSFWVFVPVVGILAFLIHRGTFFATRYIIFTLPAYLLLLAGGVLALPRLLNNRSWPVAAAGVFLVIAALVFADFGNDLLRLYNNKDKEDWRLVAQFIHNNAGPDDAVIAVKAEPTMNWYYPPAMTLGNAYDELDSIKETVASAKRSWVILSIFSSGIDSTIKAWLSDSEQGAVRFVLDPVITVYYLGHNADKEQLLAEIRAFALPADHAIYASLARENRRHPDIARRYFELAIEHAPDEAVRASYREALDALR